MKKTAMKVLAGTLAFALTIAVAPVPNAQAAKKVALDKKTLKITVGKSKKLKLKNNKKKVNWKITSGKKNIKLKAKKKTSVTIVAKKKGSAKVQAVVGKKKYTCKVTVKAAATKPVVTQTPMMTVAPTPTLTPSPSPTPTLIPTPEPTEAPEDDLNPKDVETLRAFIETLREAGAKVSEDILDSTQYIWDGEYLIEIDWSSDAGASISGDLVFPEFDDLYILSVAGTDITSLDVSACTMLEDLYCGDCKNLSSLDVSACAELGYIDCRDTDLKTLDLSGCPYMEEDYVDGPDDLEITWWTPSEEDIIALEELVSTLIKNNNAPEDIIVRDEDGELNEEHYEWDAAGHLSGIDWGGIGEIQGEISLTEFSNLTYVDIYDNALTALDLSGCSKLEYLDCSNQINDDGEKTLTSLKLKGCSALEFLDCSECALTILDLSDCIKLDIDDPECFVYDYYGLDIITPGGDSGGDTFDI